MRKQIVALIGCLTLVCFTAIAQRVVTGKVTDEKDGKPLAGVTVKVKSSLTATTTDDAGTYRIEVPRGGNSLIFSYVGYSDQEFPISGSVIDVRLGFGAQSLSEVVVTGYGTQVKRELTGNIARVKGKEIEYMPVPSVDAALQGKAAGVFVNSQSGKLGQAVTVRVRGNSSISASSQPLFVVDGVPITTNSQSSYGGATNPLTDLNPNDIESIEVLKDASAGAIYGARAANGVVLITTKRGKSGKTNVTFNFQAGVSQESNRVRMLNSEEYANMFLEATTYYDTLRGRDPNSPSSETTWAKDWMQYNSYDQWENDPTKSYDWQDQAFQAAPYYQADIQISGGNERTKYFASMQYLDQTGIVVGNDLSRATGRLNLDQKAYDWLDFGISMSLTRTINRRLPDDNAFSNPLQSVALMPMTPFTDPNTGLPAGTPPGDVNIPLYYNPMITVEYAKFHQEVYRNFSNVYGKVKLAPGLIFQTEFGADILNQNEEGYFQSQTVRNQTRAARGLGSNYSAFITNYNTNNYFNYIKTIGRSSFDATLGMQYQQSKAKYNFTEGLDFPSDSYQKIASAATKSGGSSSETNYRFNSYFLRANYKFDNKFLVSASIRRDGSSRFGENSRYGYFPSVSAGWVLSEESFLRNIQILSFLKLRASYGEVGNAEIGDFPQLGLFTGDAGYAGAAGQRPSQLGNPNLQWETTAQFDVGVDFGLFNNRLTGEIDYYKKNTSDLLLRVNVPATTGFTQQTQNVGKLENSGFEFVLNTQNTVGKLKWSTNLNFAYNKGKVNDIQGQVIEGGISSMNRVMEGQPIGIFYAVEWAGVNPQNGDAQFYLNTQDASGGLIKDKVNAAGYNAAQRMVVGDPNPDVIAGVTNTFTYAGVDFSFFFNGVFGNQINTYGMGRYSSANFRFEDNQTADQLARWTRPGQVTNVPQARWLSNNGAQISSRYIEDGSYVRLRTVSLGYNVPTKLLAKANISRLRIYMSAMNLLTFTNYTYWDPEVNADSFDSNIAKGNDFYTPPQPKTVLFGINIGL